jgi:hypothetical protein
MICVGVRFGETATLGRPKRSPCLEILFVSSAPRGRRCPSWSDVLDSWSDANLRESECDCLAHLDDDGLRYYLPALMLSLLSNYDPSCMRVIGTISALYPKTTGLATRSYAFLTDDQHRAVACFLSALPHLVMLDTEDSKCVARALRNYWGQFAAPLPQSGP